MTSRVSPRLLLAFRVVDSRRDPWPTRLTAWLTQADGGRWPEWSRFCHVEVILEVPCYRGSDSACESCNRRGFIEQAPQYAPIVHWLGFSVTTMKDRDRVFLTVDRQYTIGSTDHPQWVFWGTPLSQDEVLYASSFLQAQLRKPFNRRGAWLNRVASRCCVPGLRWEEGGRYETDATSSWFCSELATAVSQGLGLCPGEDPCFVSPNRLAWAARHSTRFVRVNPPKWRTRTARQRAQMERQASETKGPPPVHASRRFDEEAYGALHKVVVGEEHHDSEITGPLLPRHEPAVVPIPPHPNPSVTPRAASRSNWHTERVVPAVFSVRSWETLPPLPNEAPRRWRTPR